MHLVGTREPPALADPHTGQYAHHGRGDRHLDHRTQDCLGPEMLHRSGEGNEKIHDHRRPLIEMLIQAENHGHGRDHDDAAADTQQPSQDAGEKAD
ncbi:MAG: hypothetical protein QUV05_10705 [Phycisphaerae bacterium]|nr:hypothetical protein [Phycisphaerae bacterium]